jgi:hypothetical protein
MVKNNGVWMSKKVHVVKKGPWLEKNGSRFKNDSCIMKKIHILK